MTTTKKGLEFDPGFGPHILAFRGTVEYLYTDINRFKNLSQKKVKFMQYHKKILEVLYNNIGFYTGCLMWAAYLTAQPKQKILSNPCLGEKYIETDNTSEPDYIIKFLELFPKDMKYFLGQSFEFEPNLTKLVKTYKDFLVVNKGFTETQFNSDIVIPDSVNTTDFEEYKNLIDNTIKEKNLSLLKENINKLLK